MQLNDHLCTWENIRLAYANASRGKRGRPATAAFELYLGDNLLALQKEAKNKIAPPVPVGAGFAPILTVRAGQPYWAHGGII